MRTVPAEYYDIKKLKGCADTYRARIGDLRIVYEIQWVQKRVTVLVIGHREEAYSQFGKPPRTQKQIAQKEPSRNLELQIQQ